MKTLEKVAKPKLNSFSFFWHDGQVRQGTISYNKFSEGTWKVTVNCCMYKKERLFMKIFNYHSIVEVYAKNLIQKQFKCKNKIKLIGSANLKLRLN